MSDEELSVFTNLQSERECAQYREVHEMQRIAQMEWEDKTLEALTKAVASRTFTTEERRERLMGVQAEIADLDSRIHELWDEVFTGLEDEVAGCPTCDIAHKVGK